MSKELVKSKRDAIEWHRRHYKFNLSQTNANGEFTFNLDPPNEFALSDRYNQCLVKISRVSLSNAVDAVAHGMDSVFQDLAAAGVEICPCGILLYSSINSMNYGHAQGTGGQIENCVQCVIPNDKGGLGVPFPSAVAYNGLASIGASQVQLGANRDNRYSSGVWKYVDDRPIEESGTLCGNIFSHNITFDLRAAEDGARVRLVSGGNLANAATRHSAINIELEVLMLENPTSN